MRLKTALLLIVAMVVGIVFSSYFVGGLLTTQVLEPFRNVYTIAPVTVEDGVSTIPIGWDVTFVDADLIEGWIPWIIKQISILIGGLSLVVFVYAGITLVIYGDNEDQLGKSTRMIVYGIVGIALAAFSYTIVANVLNLF